MTHISRETQFWEANVEVEKLEMSKKDNGKSFMSWRYSTVANQLACRPLVSSERRPLDSIGNKLAKRLSANVCYIAYI